MPIIKGRCACDAPAHTFHIGMVKSGKKNSTTIKHIHNEFVNLSDSCNAAFDTDDW